MAATLDYLKTPSEKHPHHADWVVEGRIAVGRNEPQDGGPGFYEFHLVAPPDAKEAVGRCSNLRIDTIPPNPELDRSTPMPCLSIYKPMTDERTGSPTPEYADAIWDVATRAGSILSEDPSIGPDLLLLRLTDPVDYLSLILDSPMMSVAAQMGMIGEIQFLFLLLDRCAAITKPASRALACWRNESRDFFGNGVVFEIKTAGGDDRIHKISNVHQLEPRPHDEELHVVSASACRDSGAFNLPEWVDNLLSRLGSNDQNAALAKISTWWRWSRGYDPNLRDAFTTEPRFTHVFPPESYRIKPQMSPPLDHLQTHSFSGAAPRNAIDIQYRLDLTGGPSPLDEDEFNAAIDRMLS